MTILPIRRYTQQASQEIVPIHLLGSASYHPPYRTTSWYTFCFGVEGNPILTGADLQKTSSYVLKTGKTLWG